MARDRRKSEAEKYVLAAVASYATERPCPPPPADDAWVELAASARVLPMILDHLAESGHEAPPTAGDWRFVGVATHMRALVESRAVASTLDGTGVRWVLVKGPVLAQLIFRRPSIRPYSDLDVLVHPEDLDAAIDALQAAGFELLDRNWRLIADSMRGEISFATPAGTLLDLHWHLLNDAATRASFRLDVRQMVERRTTVDIGGVQVPTLRPADTVVHLAVHAALSGGHRLQWLLDVQQALRWCEIPPGELAAVRVERAHCWFSGRWWSGRRSTSTAVSRRCCPSSASARRGHGPGPWSRARARRSAPRRVGTPGDCSSPPPGPAQHRAHGRWHERPGRPLATSCRGVIGP